MEYFIAEEEEEQNSTNILPDKKKELTKETSDQIFALITGGLTFVAALAWNEAFKHFFNSHPIFKARGIWVYAIIVTIIAVALIIGFGFINRKIKDNITI